MIHNSPKKREISKTITSPNSTRLTSSHFHYPSKYHIYYFDPSSKKFIATNSVHIVNNTNRPATGM